MGAFDSVKNIVLPDPDNAEESAAFREKWGWEPHEMVILRGRFTAGAQKAVNNGSAKADMNGTVDIRFGDGRIIMMQELIISWTFTGDGRPLPVTPENIELLPPEYADPILEVCDRLAARGMSQEAQKRFLASANGHTPEISAAKK